MIDYRSLLDAFALCAVTKPVYLPDIRLAVGEAEDLSSQPQFYMVATPGVKAKVEPLYNMPYEKAVPDLTEDKLQEDMFPNAYYVGEAMVGGNL